MCLIHPLPEYRLSKQVVSTPNNQIDPQEYFIVPGPKGDTPPPIKPFLHSLQIQSSANRRSRLVRGSRVEDGHRAAIQRTFDEVSDSSSSCHSSQQALPQRRQQRRCLQVRKEKEKSKRQQKLINIRRLASSSSSDDDN